MSLKQGFLLKLFILVSFLIIRCVRADNIDDPDDYLFIYGAKEVKAYKKDYNKDVPVITKIIPVDKDLSIEKKVQLLCDNLSKEYFSGLRLNVMKIEEGTMHVELLENEDYNGPKEDESSWYNYFQGSTGGMRTTIILKETLLQRNYKGDWIDAVIFYYEGEEMGGWDHVMLDGILSRY
ncbi:MAG: hypothetical protein JXB49_35995 [Bacteroidales bacterium]|nr:hypothetical protein [Bacteroidales bacterium]